MKPKCCETNISENKARELLAEYGVSRTKIKTRVLLLLSKTSRPLSENEIYKKIGEKSCDI